MIVSTRASVFGAVVIAAVTWGAGWAAAQAPTNTWIGTTSSSWSTAANWDLAPASGSTTVLQFLNSGSTTYTATQDVGNPFLLNGLILNSSSSGTTTITNAVADPSSLSFVANGAVGPFLFQNNTGAVTISGASTTTGTVTFGASTTFGGGGTGAVTISAPVVFQGAGLSLAGFNTTTVSNTTATAGITLPATGLTVSGNGIGNAAFSGLIVGSTASIAVNTGANNYASGFFQLSGANTFTATSGIALQSGILAIGGTGTATSGPLGNGANTLTISGGTLRASATTTIFNPVAMSNADLVFPGTAAATFNGAVTVTGTSGLQVLGTGGVTLNNAAAFNGTTTVGVPGLVSGTLTIGSTATTNGSLLSTSGITINSQAQNSSAGNLVLTNATANSATRLSATAPITLNSGRITYTAGAGANSETFGNITVNGMGGIGTTAAGSGTTLTFGTLTRANNATVAFRGPIVGTGGAAANTVVTFANGPFTGLAPAGSGAVPIIPWAPGFSSTSGNALTLNSFVTPDGNGVRVMSVAASGNTDFSVIASGGPLAPNQNNFVSYSSGAANPATLASNTTTLVNSLLLNFSLSSGSATVAGNPGSVLQVFSGAVQTASSATISVPTLDFGAHTGYIYAFQPMTMNATMTGSAGLVVSSYQAANAGTFLLMNAPNPFTGGMTLNGSMPVQFRDDRSLGATGGGLTFGGSTLDFIAGGTYALTRPILVTPAGGALSGSGPNAIQSLISLNSSLVSGTGPLSVIGGLVALSGSTAGGWSTIVGGPNGGIVQFTGDSNFGSGPITLNGGTLQPTTAATFTRALQVNSASTIDVGGLSPTFSGAITTLGYTLGLGAPPTLTKAGTGALTLTANSSFVGPVTVSAGTLTLSGANGRLASATTATVALGAALTLDSSTANNNDRYSGPVTLTGGNFSLLGNVAGTSESIGALSSTAAGSVVTLVPASGAAATLTTTSLNVTSTGTLVVRGSSLGNTGANTAQLLVSAPPTLVNGIIPGVVGDNNPVSGGGSFLVSYSATNGIVPATLTAAGGTIQNPGTATTANVLASGATSVAGATNTINSLTLAPATSLTSAGATLTLSTGMLVAQSGAASSIDVNTIIASPTGVGLTVVSAGDLTLAAQPASGGGALVKLGAGTLTLSAGGSFAGAVTVGAGALSLQTDTSAAGLAGSGAMSVAAGTLTLNGAGGTFFGPLSGDGNFTRSSTATGTQILAGPVSLTGAIVTQAGTLSLRGSVSAAATPIMIDGAGSSGSTLEVAPGVTINRGIEFTTAGSTIRNLQTINNFPGQAAVTLAGPITLDGTLIVGTNNAVFNVSGPVGGGGGIILGGGSSGAGGTLNLLNPNNTFGNGITLEAQAGTTSLNTVLGVGASGVLGTGNIMLATGNSSNTSIVGGGYLQAIGGPQSVANPVTVNPAGPGGTILGLVGANALTLASVDTTIANLTIDNHSSNGSVLTITSLIGSNFGGPLASVTVGLPTTPAGNVVQVMSMTHQGTTTVAGGVLQVQGTADNSGGLITVTNLGTLAGTGTINRPTEIAGTIAPGTGGGSGALTLGAAMTWDAGGKYAFAYSAVTGLNAGVNYNTLASSSTLDLSGITATNPFTIYITPVGSPGTTGGPVTYTLGTFASPITGFNAANFTFNGAFAGTASVSLDGTQDLLLLSFTPSVINSSTWTGSTSGNWNTAGNWAPASVPASAATTQLVFGATPNPTMNNDIPGALTLNSMTFNAGAPVYSLGGNRLNFVSNGASLPQIVQNSANGVTIAAALTLANNLTVSGAGNLTLNGAIGGAGSLTMSGSGTLALGSGANTYSGGTAVLNGTVQVASDGALGTGNVTGGALGTVSFIGTTATTKSFAMNSGTIAVAAGQTVTFNGSQVSSAFLDGLGTIATDVTNGAEFANVSTAASVAIVSNSAADRFVHFTNSSPLTVAPGVNTTGASATVNLNGFTNQGIGSVTVGAGSRINVANFQSYGTLTLAPAPAGQITLMSNLGNSPLGFNGGSRTFIGTPPTASTNVAGIDLHGHNLIITDALFVNNGFVADGLNSGASIVVDYLGLYKGAGTTFVNIITQNGGKVQAGNSPGPSSFGQLTIGPGSFNNFGWQINDAGPSSSFPSAPGVGGPTPPPAPAAQVVSGWSQLQANKIASPLPPFTPSSGDLSWNASATPGNQFTFSLETLLGPTTPVGQSPDGAMADFDPNLKYVWPFLTWAGNYMGPTTDAALTADTLFDTSQFANSIVGTNGPGTFSLHFDGANKAIDLVFTPVPEPGTLALGSFAGLGLGWLARRRKAHGRAVWTGGPSL